MPYPDRRRFERLDAVCPVMLGHGRLTRGDGARAAGLELPDNGTVDVIENRVFDEIKVGDSASPRVAA